MEEKKKMIILMTKVGKWLCGGGLGLTVRR